MRRQEQQQQQQEQQQQHAELVMEEENKIKNKEKIALDVLKKILAWFDGGGEVAIFDATNTTKERRTNIIETCKDYQPRVHVIFIENICDDPYMLAENFKQKILTSPDYKGLPIEEATFDLKRKIHNYERVYRPIDDESLSYIKIINLKSKIICNRINGSMAQMLTSFLMSLHTQTRPIWFSRPAQCISETSNPRNPKTVFTDEGGRYARRLADMIQKRLPVRLRSKLIVFSGTSPESIETAKCITGGSHVPITALNKMETGECRGMSNKVLSEKMPAVSSAWEADRFNFRFPGGESFSDLIQRLKPFVIELEQLNVPVLIISHRAPIQALYCYFKAKLPELGPLFQVPSQTVIELVSTQRGWNEKHFKLCK